MSKPLFKPLTDFDPRAAALVAQMKQSHTPVVLTENGQSAAVLLDADTYESMRYRLALHESIEGGERAVAEGRLIPHEEARKRILGWRERK